MESCLRVSDIVNASVAIVGNTPVEKVGLHVGGGASDPFPVNFVETVRLQDECRDDSYARGRLDNGGHRSEKYIIWKVNTMQTTGYLW